MIKKTTKSRKNRRTAKGPSAIKSNKFNIKFLALFILPVAIIGGFFVYRAKASTGNYTFVRYATEMTGGTLVPKEGGSGYRSISLSTGSADTWITLDEFKNSTRFCTHYLGGKGQLLLYVRAANEPNSYITKETKYISNSSGNLCADKPYNNGSYTTPTAASIEVVSFDTANIDTIYGKP